MSKSMHRNQQNLQGAAEIGTGTGSGKRANDAVSALAALYQGEKTDASYVFNTAMAMMGIAVAYLVGAIQFIDKINQGPMAWLFLVLLPIPVWLIVAFHSLMTLNAMSHGISVRIIEQALFEVSELQVQRDLVGSAAGDKIMDITKSKPAHIVVTYFVYGGVALMVVGFTAYALYSADVIIQKSIELVHARVIWIAIGIYSVIVMIVASSWIVGFRSINKASELAESYPPRQFRNDPPAQ